MNRTALWASISILIIGVIGILLLLVRFSTQAGGGVLSLPAPVTASDWIRGDASAKVVVVEYADFQCPACGAYYPLVKQLEKDFPTNLAVVFRHFPLPQHPNAKPAARAAEAAGKQGKFWEMHDMIYENQREWSELADATPVFKKYAQTLGLDMTKFATDSADSTLLDKITSQSQVGEDAGINSTPTFFVNGEHLINPQGYPFFKAAVQAALDKATTH